jgi:citrate synthase
MPEAQSANRGLQTQEVRGVVGRDGGQHRAVHGRQTGNDLHYRGYDILDIAAECEFEEIAHLLVHEKLPNRANWPPIRPSCKACGCCPLRSRRCWSNCRRKVIPWTCCAPACRRLAAACPKANDHKSAGARDIADRLLASLGSMLCYWYSLRARRAAHRRANRRRFDRCAFPALCCMARPSAPGCVRCTPRSIFTPNMNSMPRLLRPG